MNTGEKVRKPRKRSQLRAIFRYEFLWNLRKKKVLILFLIAIGLMSVNLFLPALLGDKGTDPLFLIKNLGPNAFIMILLAVAVSMNTISGEFEEGTIIPLASKPVSRRMIYLGKILAMLASLVVIYSVLEVYFFVGSWLIYGPQHGLQLAILALPFLAALSTVVWASISLAIGSSFKSSTMAAIGTIGLFFAISIAGGIITVTSPESGQALDYLPGGGASGQVSVQLGENHFENLSITTGTNSLPQTFLMYINDPSAEVTVKQYRLNPENFENAPTSSSLKEVGSRTFSISQGFGKCLLVAMIYTLFLNLLSLKLFERAEVTES